MRIRSRLLENPFHVLGAKTDAPRPVLERTAQKLLAELAVGRASALTYDTPLGPAERTEERVRAAVAELRDPEKRILLEMWAQVPPRAADLAPDAEAPFEGARSLFVSPKVREGSD